MGAKVPHSRVLEEWTERDLTAAAWNDELTPAFEIDEQLQFACDVFASGRNLLVAGEPGVGKTALVCELVRRSVLGTAPTPLIGKKVLQFSFRQRTASLRKPDMLLPETQRLVEALLDAGPDIVPFFRDFHLAYRFDVDHQLQGLGYRFPGVILGEADPGDLAMMFESLPDLEQQYVTLTIDEPDFQRASAILSAWAADYADRKGRRFAPAAIEEALHLSHRFLARSRLPRKAIDLLIQVDGAARPAAEIGPADVTERFARAHHVPRPLVDPAEPLDLVGLRAALACELLGQPDAVNAVSRMIGLIKSGLSDTRRPFGVFLFVGPTGVGKTHAAQLLAQHLFGGRDRMIRLNMADYQANTAPELLFGDPGEFALTKRRGLLTQRMAGQPFAVVLLDEFEKAYEKVADRFLQLFDEGAFINGHGETIPCRSMILIATSNVGAEVHRDQPAGFFSPPDLSRIAHDLDRRLAQRFRIELLNRFDEIVHFHPLSRADVRTIAARELQSLKNRVGFKRSGLELEVDEAVLDWLAVHGYDPRFGARFLRRTLEREVTSALAALLVRGPAASGSVARLTVRRNRIEASLVPPSTPSIARRAPVTLPVGAGNETRSLDRDRLRATAENVGRSALALMAALDDKREEARRLLDTMNMPGFWDDADAQRRTLEQYRELDVAIQVEERFASPVRELAALIAGTDHTQVDLKTLARSVEAAAAALAQWTRRIAEEGDRAIWLLIERMDPFQPVEAWLSELTQMELAWCRRLDLTAAIIACELADGELSRVILEVEGPGAASYLACEEGVHRRVRRIGSDLKARIEVIAKRAGDQPATQAVVRTKSRRGPFGIALSCSARLELSATGQIFELMGGDPRALAELVASLEARGSRPTNASAVVARVYGQSGVGARDPRTDAIVLKLRDVLNGELDVFLDAWRRQSPEPVESTV